MDLAYFQALEEKVNGLINRMVTLRNENSEMAQANRHLEEKIQNLMGEITHLREENDRLNSKASELSASSAHDNEIANRLQEILRKVDEVVEA